MEASGLLEDPIHFGLGSSCCKMGITKQILEDCVRIGNGKGRATAPFLLVNGCDGMNDGMGWCQIALGLFPGAASFWLCGSCQLDAEQFATQCGGTTEFTPHCPTKDEMVSAGTGQMHNHGSFLVARLVLSVLRGYLGQPWRSSDSP